MKPTSLNPCPERDDAVINLAGSTFLVPGPTNVGVFAPEGEAWFVDSGNDKEAGRRLNRIANDRGWRVAGVVNTHSNADHAGGNAFLQGKTGCKIVASVSESAFIEAPEIEAAFLWGGFAPRELRNKFFEAKASAVTDRVSLPLSAKPGAIPFTALPSGLTCFPLPGHFFGMMGVVTPDRVAFLGDCLFGEPILAKYRIPFIYNAAAFKETLRLLPSVDADIFIPSHGPVLYGREALASLAEKNLTRFEELKKCLVASVESRGSASFEDVLADAAREFSVTLDSGQYALVGCTVRSFLTYLYDEGALIPEFTDNRLTWKRAESAT